MMEANLKSITAPDLTIGLRPGAPGLVVIYETAIPATYWVLPEPRLDRQSLNADLKRGASNIIRFSSSKICTTQGDGQKVSDEFTVPLCRIHHRQLHHGGNEVNWWIDMDIDPLPIAKELWDKSKAGQEP